MSRHIATNHIAAKFASLEIAPLPVDEFKQAMSGLTAKLREHYPRYEERTISGFQFSLSDQSFTNRQPLEDKELHMVDAEGNWGVKIGNRGISLSTAKYEPYEEVLTRFQELLNTCVACLKISFFSKTSLRNINLFNEVADKHNHFEDIKHAAYWGRQDFDTLGEGFLCSGASTRHEYISPDFHSRIQLVSGIVIGGQRQSYIPQDQWDIWQLRGGIPVSSADGAQLLIDIAATKSEASLQQPGTVSPYSWKKVKESLDGLHKIINNVYADIIQE